VEETVGGTEGDGKMSKAIPLIKNQHLPIQFQAHLKALSSKCLIPMQAKIAPLSLTHAYLRIKMMLPMTPNPSLSERIKEKGVLSYDLHQTTKKLKSKPQLPDLLRRSKTC